jgi:hypothetical protein
VAPVEDSLELLMVSESREDVGRSSGEPNCIKCCEALAEPILKVGESPLVVEAEDEA